MKKKFLYIALIFITLFAIAPITFAEGGGEPDFVLEAVHQVYKEGTSEYPMVLILKNNTENTITITGDENDQLTIFAKENPSPMAKIEAFVFNFYDNVKSIEIEPNQSKEIVKVSAGSADSWRGFHKTGIYGPIDVKIKINDEEKTFENISYGVLGEISYPKYCGEINITDNEDGTATFKFQLFAIQENYNIVCSGLHCDSIDLGVEKAGLKTGIKKEHFAVIKEGQVIGKIIQAKEITPGNYEVVWQNKPGKYEYVMLNTSHPFGDDYIFNTLDEENTYGVTITHTKDPIILKHDEVGFETAGATNIPKLVTLFFKEISEDISEDKMDLFEKNVQNVDTKKEIVHIYDISLLLDGVEIQPDGNVKITIPLNDKMKKYVDLKVVYITDTGEVIEVESEVTENGISFITDHFSYYAVIGVSEDNVPKSPKTGESAIYYALFISAIALLGIGITLRKEYLK